VRSIGTRSYSVAAIAGVIGALMLPAGASAAVTGQTLPVMASNPKQPKTQFGPLQSLMITVDTAYAPPFTPTATQTVISFSRDFMFSPGGLPQCNLSAINTVPQAQADAICGSSKVGTGSATINGGLLTGVVSAYNGTPSGGQPDDRPAHRRVHRLRVVCVQHDTDRCSQPQREYPGRRDPAHGHGDHAFRDHDQSDQDRHEEPTADLLHDGSL
jgi:hypothetical protein